MSFNVSSYARETYQFAKGQLSSRKLHTEPKKKHIVLSKDSKAIDREKMKQSLYKSTAEKNK
jgi:hypothetical protein